MLIDNYFILNCFLSRFRREVLVVGIAFSAAVAKRTSSRVSGGPRPPRKSIIIPPTVRVVWLTRSAVLVHVRDGGINYVLYNDFMIIVSSASRGCRRRYLRGAAGASAPHRVHKHGRRNSLRGGTVRTEKVLLRRHANRKPRECTDLPRERSSQD